jgi:hypothetical protein
VLYSELKKRWRSKFDQARQRLLLTPTEKRVVVFILAAFALGLGTKCYRDAHPSFVELGRARPEPARRGEGAPAFTPAQEITPP